MAQGFIPEKSEKQNLQYYRKKETAKDKQNK